MDNLSIITQLYEQMKQDEKIRFLKYLKDKNAKKSKNNFSIDLNFKIEKCPHCSSKSVVKNGHKDGIQRFKCNECGKTFTYTNNTILFSSKKNIDLWIKFCECLMNKFPIRKCAEICNISTHTAFNWRHKVLDILQNMQAGVHLKGIIEADETFFALSYKGNHKKFKLPRDAHKRGHSGSTRGLSKEMVCVPSIVNLDRMSIDKISNLEKPGLKDLSKVIDTRIEQGSILVTDSFKAYNKVAFDNELTYIRILKGKYTNGSFNIQTINSYHSELKRLIIGNFKGVATKYLNNYIVYHNFVNFAKDNFMNKLNILANFIFKTKYNIKGYNIVKRDAVPV